MLERRAIDRAAGVPPCAAGVLVFELARVMGTSVAMIERHYGTLIEGAGADIARRLTASEAQEERATSERASGV